ncbi:MAG TPA: hypothetical protein VEZ11_05510 [Thermoanaerobaculia bacterium]|nr:hypothetical protein [Thermoanaerobaculia bacterium]
MHRRNLGDMLLAANLIDEVQMQIALAEQRRNGRRFGSTLVELKFIDENVLAAFLSKQIDVPCISLLHIDVPKKVVRKLHRAIAVECQAVPVRIADDRLEVAMVDPTDLELLEKLEISVGMTVSPLIAPQSSIVSMIDKFYPLEQSPEDTLSVRHRGSGETPIDPIFRDLIDDLESGDLEKRLAGIEASLDRIWTLLERILRHLEIRDGVPRHDQ